MGCIAHCLIVGYLGCLDTNTTKYRVYIIYYSQQIIRLFTRTFLLSVIDTKLTSQHWEFWIMLIMHEVVLSWLNDDVVELRNGSVSQLIF